MLLNFLFVKFLDDIKHPYFYYIPDRQKDGYGATKKLFQKLILRNPKLVIMVDCGSTSNEAIDFLNEKKIKSLPGPAPASIVTVR